MKILVAEDDFFSRKLLNKILSSLGEVDIAASGKEALAAVKSGLDDHAHYRLICLDVMMPQMDGLTALQAIRQLESHAGLREENRAKIVMTTASSDRKKVLAAAKAGCDAYLIKPITKPRLLEELARLGIAAPLADAG